MFKEGAAKLALVPVLVLVVKQAMDNGRQSRRRSRKVDMVMVW
jgi:hypothetical protein